MRRTNGRRTAFLGFAAAAAVALGLLVQQASGVTIVTYGCTANVMLVQATKGGRDTYDVDPKIPTVIKTALISTYKQKYMKYTLIRSEDVYLAWRHQDTNNKREGRTDQVQIALPSGSNLLITYLGFRKTTFSYKINFQFQCGTQYSLPDIPDGANFIQKVSEDENPVLLIFTPKLSQVIR